MIEHIEKHLKLNKKFFEEFNIQPIDIKKEIGEKKLKKHNVIDECEYIIDEKYMEIEEEIQKTHSELYKFKLKDKESEKHTILSYILSPLNNEGMLFSINENSLSILKKYTIIQNSIDQICLECKKLNFDPILNTDAIKI